MSLMLHFIDNMSKMPLNLRSLMVLPISEMISQIKLPMFLELLDICD